MASFRTDSFHLLSIQLESAPSNLLAVLALGRDDVEHWLMRAAAAGVPLVIVRGPDSVDLYSTEEGRRAAFKPLLESLWSLGRNLEGFERVRATEASGHAAVRHLLRQAAGLASTEHGVSYVSSITQACARAARFGTLSDGLRYVFHVATSTAGRSQAETELSAPHSTHESRQIEALTAERIVEEELMAFKVAAADEERRSSSPAPRSSLLPEGRASLLPGYGGSEPGSSVRLRVAPFSILPVPTRHSG